MAPNKWIRVKSGDERVALVAARIFRSRLKAIGYYLEQLEQPTVQNEEAVHQLRVWTRRTEAALKLCRSLLKKKPRRKLAKLLRLIRNRAGVVRDADVLGKLAAQLKAGLVRKRLTEDCENRSLLGRVALGIECELLQKKKEVQKTSRRITEQLRHSSSPQELQHPFRKWARENTQPLVKKFLKRGKEDLSDLAALHRFRISIKQLRYGMELVAGAFEKSFRKKLYLQLGELQTELGEMNDRRALIVALEQALQDDASRTLKTQLRRAMIAEQRSLSNRLEAWLASWTKKRRQHLARAFKRHLK